MKEKAYYIANKARQILGGTLSANQCRDYVGIFSKCSSF